MSLPLSYPFPAVRKGNQPGEIAWARKNHPLCPVLLPDGRRVWMLTRRDDITRVYTDPRFSRLAVARPGPIPDGLLENLLDALESGPDPVDLAEALVAPLESHVGREMKAVFAAGIVTLLAHRPQVLSCIGDETRWPGAAEEVLRHHHHGVLGHPLVATESCTLHDVSLEPGELVCAPMLPGFWDPARFDAPVKFVAGRTSPRSRTPQNLFLGDTYAALFRRFPELSLAVSEDDIPWLHDLLIPEPAVVPVLLGSLSSRR